MNFGKNKIFLNYIEGKKGLEVFHKRKRIRKNNVNLKQKRSESIDGIELYRCHSCNFSTTSENGIQIHLAKHKGKYQLLICINKVRTLCKFAIFISPIFLLF